MNPRARQTITTLVTLITLAFVATTAQAANYGITSSFGTFVEPADVAVDQSTGDVYVVDTGVSPEAVYKFDVAGKPVNFTALGTNALTGHTGAADATPQGGFSLYGLGSYGSGATVAIDSSGGATNGDIYVADAGHNVVDVFRSDGTYIGQLREAPGAPWGTVYGVIVDTNGNVYVNSSSYSGGAVDKFAPHANPVANSDYVSSLTGFRGFPAALAVDSADNIYVSEYDWNPVLRYAPDQFGQAYPTGTLIDPNNVLSLAVEPGTNDVYMDEATSIAKYSPAGDLITTFGKEGFPALVKSFGVAVGPTGTVYASDSGTGKVDIFSEGDPPPVPRTDSGSLVTSTSVTLNGDLNPGGIDTHYYFSYNAGSTCTGGSRTPVGDGGSGSVDVSESALVENLQPNKQYAFCFVAVNPFGATAGSPLTFTTLAVKPAVDSESSAVYGPTVAGLQAQINPENEDTKYYFQYGATASYESGDIPAVPGADVGSGFGDVSVETGVTGLQANGLYHYRVVAINATGETYGPDQTFTTPPPPPVVITGGASEITSIAATVSGTVNPGGLSAKYYYQYGISTEYGSKTAIAFAGAGEAPRSVQVILQDLNPGTTYHYRLVSENEDGTSYGEDQQVTTGTYADPVAVTGQASGITSNAATLLGTVDPEGIHGRYEFELGGDTTYGIQVFGDAGTGSESEPVQLSVANLLPGTVYHYRVCAITEAGSACGADVSFVTPGILSPLVSPPSLPFLGIPAIGFPRESGSTATKGLTNAQKLARALKACAKKSKAKRAGCVRQAHKKYSAGSAKRTVDHKKLAR
jgi:hypothetical protein